VAVRKLASEVELMIVVGSRNSSNTNRLRDLSIEMGIPTFMIDDANDLDPTWFVDIERVGITAGASAPEQLVQEIIERLCELVGDVELRVLDGIKERVRFKLPKEITDQEVTYGSKDAPAQA
jgi:4-hydroxy-3-methylbut-2-enyl diphosphate reductase